MTMRTTGFARCQSGAAALEFAIIVAFLTPAVLNVIDIGLYLFQKVQVENAGQIAVQAAWKACDESSEQRPATTKCLPAGGALAAHMRTVAQTSTSLGNRVTVGAPSSKYYCLNNSNQLVLVATAPTASPANCSSVRTTAPVPVPGEYVEVTTSYAYVPLFSPVSVGRLFATPITYSARVRMN
jgi:Flp pilus assembly protein TadG